MIVAVRECRLVPPEVVAEPDRLRLQAFADAMKAPFFVAQLLERQGVTDTESARRFFVPDAECLHSSKDMLDMDKALALLQDIRASGERIVVHGDYDVDGISGATLLYTGLRECGFRNVGWFLPNRFEQGYGLCPATVERFVAEGVRWVLTVDTGISAVPEVELANKHGIRVIVCDHHQEGPELPAAEAILNPNRHACTYPNKFLSGVGVAWKLLDSLMHQCLGRGAEHYLDLVALGTLADLMPLKGENRWLVRQGLRQLVHTPRPGLRALVEEAKLDAEYPRGQDVLFRITPLINAAGRMGAPDLAFKLLTAPQMDDARRLILQLKERNKDRRRCEKEMVADAIHRIESCPVLSAAPVLVLGDERWNQGVVGIVAARLIERFHRPVAVLSYVDGFGKASCRSVEGFNWHRALEEVQHMLEKWGGHCFAAGFTVRQESVAELNERLCDIARRVNFVPRRLSEVRAEYALALDELDKGLMQWLQRCEPFGAENPSPRFYAQNVRIVGVPEVVGGEHLKLKLTQGGRVFDAIAFQQAQQLPILESAGTFSIAYCPVWNTWRERRGGEREIQVQVMAFGE